MKVIPETRHVHYIWYLRFIPMPNVLYVYFSSKVGRKRQSHHYNSTSMYVIHNLYHY